MWISVVKVVRILGKVEVVVKHTSGLTAEIVPSIGVDSMSLFSTHTMVSVNRVA